MNAHRIRQIVLEQSRRAHVGHIGSALGIADLIAALYSGAMNIPSPEHVDRDRFVLSKGHAALALYAALSLRGWLSDDELNSYCGEDSLLGVHPERELRGVDFSTGSLGQGLSMGTGAALAARMQGSKRRVFVLVSDAECNEGALWEAAMFAAHRQLSNLIVLVDLDGQQALGYTRDVLDLAPMSARWNAFGWDAREVDGHDVSQIDCAVRDFDTESGPPHVLIARTTFGKGVSYMENQIKWHYWPMDADEYRQALEEVGSGP